MKKYIFLSLALISCGSADNTKDKSHADSYKIISGKMHDYIMVVEIDHCHYILFDGSNKGGIVHKENCPNHK